MHEYEIRLLTSTGRPSLITVEMQLTDAAAIRSGKRLARGTQFEVWRGDQRIFCSHPSRPHAVGDPSTWP